MAKTAGQKFMTEMRTNHAIGARTRRFRKGLDLHAEILASVRNAVHYPGYYSEGRTDVFRAAFASVCAYDKHIGGYRVSPDVQAHVSSLSPWAFCALIADMIDAGVTNAGQGEAYFRNLSVRGVDRGRSID